VDAIEATQYQQDQREIVQTTYSKHRKSLDKFEGECRKNKKTDLGKDDVNEINELLKEAGCTNLLNYESVQECKVMADDESKMWNKDKLVYQEYDPGESKSRWLDMLSDKKIHTAIDETVNTLEAIIRTAINQRRKKKLLHIRHAALTMDSHILSKLLLPMPGDPPEPNFTIIDDNTGEMRPC
jgi:hypothetical protein